MQRTLRCVVWSEDDWFIAQCLDVDVVSQGESESDALANLKEALELYFEGPFPTTRPKYHDIVIDIDAA